MNVMEHLGGQFVAPGMIEVSAEAFTLARAFLDGVKQTQSVADWIVCFDWAYSRKVRKNFGPMLELGPGVDLVMYERSYVPEDRIQSRDGIEFAIGVPVSAYINSVRRLIDVEGDDGSRLVLR
jgi:hypothetical protein